MMGAHKGTRQKVYDHTPANPQWKQTAPDRWTRADGIYVGPAPAVHISSTGTRMWRVFSRSGIMLGQAQRHPCEKGSASRAFVTVESAMIGADKAWPLLNDV